MKTIILLILALCCLPFFGVGLYEAYKNNREIGNFKHTEGTVVGNSYQIVSDEGRASGTYLPEVEFLLPDGKKVRFTDGVGSLPPDYEVGTKLAVIYDPKHPQNARINSLKRIWLAPAIFMTVGLVPLVIGFIIMRRLNL